MKWRKPEWTEICEDGWKFMGRDQDPHWCFPTSKQPTLVMEKKLESFIMELNMHLAQGSERVKEDPIDFADAVSSSYMMREQTSDNMNKPWQHLMVCTGLPSIKRNMIAALFPLPNLIQNVSVAHTNLEPYREVNSGKCHSSLVKWTEQIYHIGYMTREMERERARALMRSSETLDPARSEAITIPRISSYVNYLAYARLKWVPVFWKWKWPDDWYN